MEEITDYLRLHMDRVFSSGDVNAGLVKLEQFAEQGAAEAFTKLGEIYREGFIVKKDDKKAHDYFEKADDLGDPNGTNFNAEYLLQRNKMLATAMFETAASNGSPFAMYNAALMYKEREDVHTYTAYVDKLHDCADAGDPNAMMIVGRGYSEGRIFGPNLEHAYMWYQKAADAGLARGMYILGLCNWNGTGTSKDRPKAIFYFERAEAMGSPHASKFFRHPVNKIIRLFTGKIYDHSVVDQHDEMNKD